jgi:hypothetical protein
MCHHVAYCRAFIDLLRAEQATADLVEIASKLISDSVEPKWDSVNMTRTYDSAVGDQGDWRVNAVLLSVTGALTFDGLRAGFTIIQFIAVRAELLRLLHFLILLFPYSGILSGYVG